MIDRNSKEFKELIENPLTQMLKTTADFYTAPIKAAGDAVLSPTGAAVVVSAAAIIAASYKLYKDYIDKAGSHCRKTVPQPQRKHCELKFNLKAKQAQLNKLLNGRNNCKDKDCYTKLDQKSNQLKREIQMLSSKLSTTKKPSTPEGRNDEISKGESEESK